MKNPYRWPAAFGPVFSGGRAGRPGEEKERFPQNLKRSAQHERKRAAGRREIRECAGYFRRRKRTDPPWQRRKTVSSVKDGAGCRGLLFTFYEEEKYHYRYKLIDEKNCFGSDEKRQEEQQLLLQDNEAKKTKEEVEHPKDCISKISKALIELNKMDKEDNTDQEVLTGFNKLVDDYKKLIRLENKTQIPIFEIVDIEICQS